MIAVLIFCIAHEQHVYGRYAGLTTATCTSSCTSSQYLSQDTMYVHMYIMYLQNDNPVKALQVTQGYTI